MSLGTQAGSGTQGNDQPRNDQSLWKAIALIAALCLVGAIIYFATNKAAVDASLETIESSASEGAKKAQEAAKQAAEDAYKAAHSDTDGIPNDVESEWGSDPFSEDTDGDGFSDADEYMQLSNGSWRPKVSATANACDGRRLYDFEDPCIPDMGSSKCPCNPLKTATQLRREGKAGLCDHCHQRHVGDCKQGRKGQKSSSEKKKSHSTVSDDCGCDGFRRMGYSTKSSCLNACSPKRFPCQQYNEAGTCIEVVDAQSGKRYRDARAKSGQQGLRW